MKTSLLGLLVIFHAFYALASDAGTPQPQTNGWERYKIVTQRNIFSKDRGRREERHSEERTKGKDAPPPPSKPEADLLLIGILERDGELVAFFENTKAGGIQGLKAGEAIARGKITALTLDGIDYTLEDSTSKIAIGSNLEGTAVSNKGEPVNTASTTSSSTPGSTDVNALMERMRKKRQEEMRK